MTEKYYRINREDLVELLASYYELMALNYGGVDNWDWHGGSCQEFIDTHNRENGTQYESFQEIAESELANYDEVS